MDKRWKSRAVMAAAVLALASCERPLSPPSPGQLALEVVSGDQQQGEAGQELAQPLVVKVTRADGGPMRGQILNFRVVSGGGSVFGGAEITDNSGMAQELWTLGTRAGEPQRIEVRAVDPQTGEPQTFAAFTATAVAGPPARMTTLSGDGQQVEPGQTVPIPPSVKLEDQYGNPTANVGVAFTVVRGSVTNGDAVTNANGVATVGSWTLRLLDDQSVARYCSVAWRAGGDQWKALCCWWVRRRELPINDVRTISPGIRPFQRSLDGCW